MLKNNGIMKRVLGFCICILVCLATAFTVSYFYSFAKDYFAADYEFSADGDPKVGETIVLNGLTDKNGKSFIDTKHKKFILLGIIDPDCGACAVAKDQIMLIQEGLQNTNVEYVLVSFTSKVSLQKFSAYADSFNLSSNSFLWKGSSNPSPQSLLTAVVPTHLLITSDGKILRKFYGTDKETSVRKKMVRQIIKEINAEIQKPTNE